MDNEQWETSVPNIQIIVDLHHLGMTAAANISFQTGRMTEKSAEALRERLDDVNLIRQMKNAIP